MSDEMEILTSNDTAEGIKNKIYTIRGVQVMLESDLHQKEADKKIAEIFTLMDWECGTGVFKSRLARAWSHAEGS